MSAIEQAAQVLLSAESRNSRGDIQRIWYHYAGRRGCLAGAVEDVKSLLAEILLDEPYIAYCYGSRCQASTILELARHAYGESGVSRIAIGTPAVEVGGLQSRQPLAMLQTMASLHSWPMWRGGWRQLAVNDLNMLQLLATPSPQTLVSHPVYPLLCSLFEPPANALPEELDRRCENMRQVLCHVQDVRWHYRQITPEGSTNLLQLCLGVTGKTLHDWLAGGVPRQRLSHTALPHLLELCFGPRVSVSLLQAASFGDGLACDLFRRYFEVYKAEGSSAASTKALLKSLRVVVEYLHYGWLHEVSPRGCEWLVPKYLLQQHLDEPVLSLRVAKLKQARERLPQRVGYSPLENHYMRVNG